MDEKTLTYTAYVVFIVSIVFLFFYAQEFEVETVPTLEYHPTSETVKMHGLLTRVTEKDNVIFAELEGERIEKTSVIVFTTQDVFLKEGQYVEIEGKVEQYKGKKEIIAQKVLIR